MPLLKDPLRQQEFESRGYTVLDFLDRPAVECLAQLYASLDVACTSTRLSSVAGERPELFRSLRNALADIAASALERHFVPCDLLLADFLTKPQRGSAVAPHQDWTILDEDGGAAGNIWLPLNGVELRTGALGVLPGSHRAFRDIRYAPSAQGYRMLPYADVAMELFPYLEFLPLRLGEALVFHSDAVHGSLPNLSDDPRVTAIFAVAAKQCRMSLHYVLPDTQLTKFESFAIAPDDFVEYHNIALQSMFNRGARPEGLPSRGVFDLRQARLSRDEAIARVESAGGLRRDLPA